MQMGYDFDDGRQTARPVPRIGGFGESWPRRGEDAAEGLSGRHPDWNSLRARFVAVHALRRTMTFAEDSALPAGSFVTAGEAVLATCRPDHGGVNLVYSANGKGADANKGSVAASPTPGDRGIQ